MKFVIARKDARRILKWTRHSLLAASASLFGYCVYVAADAWTFQRDQHIQVTKPETETVSVTPLPIGAGDPIGRVVIARLGISVVVAEGTNRLTLRRAVGHIPGTALPGQPGNTAISGHRDTFFRPLRNVRQNDMIEITTHRGEYRYRVVSTKIVGPSDVSVLDSSESQVLTLVTCYPFYFVGPAPDRFIVRAERVNW